MLQSPAQRLEEQILGEKIKGGESIDRQEKEAGAGSVQKEKGGKDYRQAVVFLLIRPAGPCTVALSESFGGIPRFRRRKPQQE